MSQLTFKFPFKTSYFEKDFYVSSNNFAVYKLIESWPNWPSRLVNIFGYKMEVNPNGTLLFVQNDDVPGVIGKVGTLLGDNKINIAAYLLSREKNKNLAFAVIRLDDSIEPSIIDMLSNIKELKFLRQISLEGH